MINLVGLAYILKRKVMNIFKSHHLNLVIENKTMVCRTNLSFMYFESVTYYFCVPERKDLFKEDQLCYCHK